MKNQNKKPNIEISEEDEVLKENYKLLYYFNMTFLAGHIWLLAAFICLGVKEMAILNVISIAWYGYNAYRMRNKQLEKYMQAEVIMMVEMIVHQWLAIYYLGLDFGFQYIFLSCSCTLFTLYRNKQGKKSYIAKSLIMIVMFLIPDIVLKKYTPVYQFNDIICVIVRSMIFLYAFLTLSYCTLKSYTNIYDAMDRFQRETIQKTDKILNIQQEVIGSLANIIESRDGSTGEHIKRTSIYVDALLEELKKKEKYKKIITKEFVDNIKKAAPLHDIGKIKVPDRILQKPGKLTKEEFEVIKKHSQDGGKLIEESIGKIEDKEYTQIAYNVATFHHERWDGTGYPLHLKGDEIPFEARIMALADVYDALTAERCYKKAFGKEQALKIIMEGKETQFDPDLCEIFVYAMQKSHEEEITTINEEVI